MGGIFKTPKAPPIPKPQPLPEYTPPPAPEPEPEMPVADEAAVLTAEKKKRALASKRSGRASTLFTDEDDGRLG